MRVRPVDLEDGAVRSGLVLRQLTTTGVFMQATAHPDDENNALHVIVESRAGRAHDAGDGDARRRRSERDRAGALRRAGGAAN